MKKNILNYLFCLLLVPSANFTFAQDVLVDFTYLGSRTRFELLPIFGLLVDYDIDLYRIRYKTMDVHMVPDTASGLMVLPQVPDSAKLPLVVYDHGTTSGPTDVPSQLRGGFEVAMAYAGYGFATLAPDYLGLGDARGFHPYVHAATEASASLDMLFAGYEYLEFHDPDVDEAFLFLAGYSQGGHASMALHKVIDDFWSVIIPVTAATHMSGPYSISGVMRDKILSDESYGFPAYIAYIVLGYNEAYGNLYTDINEIFKEPYATSIQSFYDGTISLTTLNSQLIASLNISGDTINKRMFHDSIITAITTEPDHPINVALEDNDTYDWAPMSPTRLYYCGADQQVPPENSVLAEATMQSNGATDVEAINLNPALDHGPCVFPAIQSSIAFFQSFLNPSSLDEQNINTAELTISPNPVLDEIVIDWETGSGKIYYELYSVNGFRVEQGYTNSNRISVVHLASGMYLIKCTTGSETRMTRFVHP